MTPWPVEFYVRDPLVVAPALLGSLLVHRHPERGELVGRIVETEAYRGEEDLACHASKGRTPRASTLFGPPGLAYVYLIYGMYDMLNAVTWPEGLASAVLIRAVEPIRGIDRTTDGPGKVTRAFGIDRTLNEEPLTGARLFIAPGEPVPSERIGITPRIGVDYAGDWAQRPWRFIERGNRHVSKPRA